MQDQLNPTPDEQSPGLQTKERNNVDDTDKKGSKTAEI